MQRSQRFVADQRFDLPQYDSMISLISAEFNAYNKALLAPLNRIVKNWKIVNSGGLVVAVDQTTDSTLFNTQRASHEQFILRELTRPQLTLTLADNATNYVEVQMVTSTCSPDTVAIWDTTANGGVGQEFTQNVDTVLQEQPVLVSNTVAFTGDADKIRLAVVVTSGGSISSITDSRQFLYHVDTDWDFGTPRSDKTIGSLKEAFDALATVHKESKGTSTWEATGWSSIAKVKEYQNLFFSGGGTLSWTSNQITFTLAINIDIADRANSYTITAGTYSIPSGSALYVDIPEDVVSGALTPIIAAMSAVPINPTSSGFTGRSQVIFFNRSGVLYANMDLPTLEAGESAQIGESISQTIAGRLGITNDTTYAAYTSTSVILANDNYAAAISKLDAAILSIVQSTPTEEHFVVTNPGGQTVFTASSITWNPAVNNLDIFVFINGMKQRQDGAGTNLWDFKKTSSTSITFASAVTKDSTVCIRLGAAGDVGAGGGGGGSTDLDNIATNPAPDTNGGRTLGTTSKGWAGLILKDTATSTHWLITMDNGVMNITSV